jgi:hypothetical protein
MPRHKVVGGVDEVEYRLEKIMTASLTGRINSAQCLAALAALSAYAYMHKVDMGPDFTTLVRKVSIYATGGPKPPEVVGPSLAKPEDKKEQLTIQPPDDIFGGLEDFDAEN